MGGVLSPSATGWIPASALRRWEHAGNRLLRGHLVPAGLMVALCLAASGTRAAESGPPSRTLAPGPRYEAGWLTRVLLGAQWRDLWTTPVEVPVLDLRSFDG